MRPFEQPRLAFAPAQSASRGDVLIVIFLRGAADVLNMIVPHGEHAYYAARPSLAIARPDDERAAVAQRAIDLDGFFGLHPQLRALMPAWQARQLAVVHACGAPDESRSHFKAMALMERGVDDERGPASGWIGRHLAALNTGNASPLRAVAIGETLPRSLLGNVPATALRSIVDAHLGSDERAARRFRQTLAALYGAPTAHPVGPTTLGMIDTLGALRLDRYAPARGARYPDSAFGLGLRQVAMLVKAAVGLEVAVLDLGGWDTHIAQGGAEGWMAGLLGDLGNGLAALHSDLFEQMPRVSIVVMSEFGRRLGENGGLGTDHGHGSAMLLLGGHVRGGRVHGRWPGLLREQLVGPGDLAVTTDYRDVLGELLAKRLNNTQLAQVFPGHSVSGAGVFEEGA